MGQGDIPTSRGGPLRRRREKRQLEHLAEESDREVTPGTDRTHVRVLEDGGIVEKPAPVEREPSEPGGCPPRDADGLPRPGGADRPALRRVTRADRAARHVRASGPSFALGFFSLENVPRIR